MVFYPASRGVEGVANGHVGIFIGVVLARVTVHCDVRAGQAQLDMNFEELP